jgi:hypothetical protein
MIRVFHHLAIGFSLFIGLLIVPPAANATPIHRIVFTVPDVTAFPGEQHRFLDIYLDTPFDSIAGFQFVLRTSRPDLVTFDFANGGFDTAGTLVSGFEYAASRDSLGDQTLLWFRCMANLPFDTKITPAFPPQQGGIAVRIPVNITPAPDSLIDLTSALEVVPPFDFSNPWGVSIGVITDTVFDSTFFTCLDWLEDSCLTWDSTKTEPPEWDSVFIDSLGYGYLDTTVVAKHDGSVTVLAGMIMCDINLSGSIDISDLVCLIEYLFGSFNSETCPFLQCDTDNSGVLDISDLAYLVNYLFDNGPPPQ